MRVRLARLAMIVVSLMAFSFAYVSCERATERQGSIDTAVRQLSEVNNQIAALENVQPKPLKPRDETLEDILGRLVDDTELLGSSVRLNLDKGGLQWQPVRYGVDKAVLSISSAADNDAAMGYFSILWQLIQERPATVKTAKITVGESVSWFTIDVEIYALTGESS